jgi:hypothetical protein
MKSNNQTTSIPVSSVFLLYSVEYLEESMKACDHTLELELLVLGEESLVVSRHQGLHLTSLQVGHLHTQAFLHKKHIFQNKIFTILYNKYTSTNGYMVCDM